MAAHSSPPASVILVTGFLGSGKTTFLNRLLAGMKNRRTGLIINDFGSIPVDYELVRHSAPVGEAERDQLIISIENGSIFCSCRKSVFIDGLEYFKKEKCEYLVIETSGISDPSEVRQLLSRPEFSDSYRLHAVICLTAADTLRQMKARFLFVERQFSAANYIILNKSDLCDPKELRHLEQELSELNPSARVLTAGYGRTETDFLAGPDDSQSADFSQSPPSDKPESCTLPADALSLTALERAVPELKTVLIRIKGFITESGTFYEVNGTSSEIRITPAGFTPAATGLTLIYDPANRPAVLELIETLRMSHS